MLYDLSAKDACFVDGRPPDDIHGVLDLVDRQLRSGADCSWKLISGRRRFGKILVELELTTSRGSERVIGKICSTERAKTLHATLIQLREVGFKPPSTFIVPESLGCLPEEGLVLQMKATGTSAHDLIVAGGETAAAAADQAAQWLVHLHNSRVSAPRSASLLERVPPWTEDLCRKVSSSATAFRRIAAAIHDELCAPASNSVPCHGDFHPMNIFIADT